MGREVAKLRIANCRFNKLNRSSGISLIRVHLRSSAAQHVFAFPGVWKGSKKSLATDGAQMHTDGKTGDCKLEIPNLKSEIGNRKSQIRKKPVQHPTASFFEYFSAFLRASAVNPRSNSAHKRAADGGIRG